MAAVATLAKEQLLALAQPPSQAPFQGEAGRLIAEGQRREAAG